MTRYKKRREATPRRRHGLLVHITARSNSKWEASNWILETRPKAASDALFSRVLRSGESRKVRCRLQHLISPSPTNCQGKPSPLFLVQRRMILRLYFIYSCFLLSQTCYIPSLPRAVLAILVRHQHRASKSTGPLPRLYPCPRTTITTTKVRQ